MDGELVVWESGRLAFDRLQGRLQRRGAGAGWLAQEWPAHFVAFDLLRQTAEDTAAWPYERRRAAPQTPLTENDLTAPWALGPSTTDPDTVREWLTWTAVGLEGLPFKRLDSPYRPAVRGWRKYKVARARRDRRRRRPPAPRSLLLGRFDTDERWQYTGRSTTLTQAAGATLASLLSPAAGEHPWTGWTFTAG